MPNNAPQIKRDATAKLGAEIVLVGPGSDERKNKAEELAAQHGYAIVPPTTMKKSSPDKAPSAWKSSTICPKSKPSLPRWVVEV